jgi:hypothetical protein
MTRNVVAPCKHKHAESQKEVNAMDTLEFNGSKNKWLLCAVRAADYVLEHTDKQGMDAINLVGTVLVGKFRQHPELKTKLLDTGECKIVFKRKTHELGKHNTLGLVLMRVRSKLKKEENTEPCPNMALKENQNGCYQGEYWVQDFHGGGMRKLGKCYKCAGKGFITTEGHTREDGEHVWSDQERNDRYERKTKGDQVLSPKDLEPKDIKRALDEEEFSLC